MEGISASSEKNECLIESASHLRLARIRIREFVSSVSPPCRCAALDSSVTSSLARFDVRIGTIGKSEVI